MKYFKRNLLPIQRPSRHSTEPPSNSLQSHAQSSENSRQRDAALKVIGKIAAYHAQAPKGEGGGGECTPPEVPPAFVAVPRTVEQKIFPTICGLCAPEKCRLFGRTQGRSKKAAKKVVTQQ